MSILEVQRVFDEHNEAVRSARSAVEYSDVLDQKSAAEAEARERRKLFEPYRKAVTSGDLKAAIASLKKMPRDCGDQRSPDDKAAADIAAVGAYDAALAAYSKRLEVTREVRAWAQIIAAAEEWAGQVEGDADGAKRRSTAFETEIGRMRAFGKAVDRDLAKVRDEDSKAIEGIKQKLLSEVVLLPIGDTVLPIKKAPKHRSKP